jgi:ribokinase
MRERRGRVIVAGSINVDLIVRAPRLPRSGETVLGDRFVQQNGGKSANQAVAASRAGADVTLIGAVGGDAFGRAALAGLTEAGIDVSHCRSLPDAHTGLALIVVDTAGENQIAVASGANARLDAAMIDAELAALSPPSTGVCLLGFEVSDEAVLSVARWAVDHGLRIVLNPAPARPVAAELLSLQPILTPNASEAQSLSGERDPALAASALASLTGAPVVVTLGADGAVLWADGAPRFVPAYPVQPLDTTGAGDALNGILAAELARGADLSSALRWAMIGAALKTTQPGAQAGLPSRDTIAQHIRRSG